MSLSGLGRVRVDHARLARAARELLDQRAAIEDYCLQCRDQMERVSEVMQSLAGTGILRRFNNLGEKYFGEYQRSMIDHAAFLEKAAARYLLADEQTETASKSASALAHFEDV